MKKYFNFLIIAFALALQSGLAQIYLPGQVALELKASAVNGLTKDALAGGLGFSQYTERGNRWVFAAEYLQKRFAYGRTWLPVAQFTGEGGFYLNFLSDRSKTIFLSLGCSAMAGYESVNWGKTGNMTLYDGAALHDRSAVIGGLAPAFEIEIFPLDRVALLLGCRERILFGSTVSLFHFQAYAGLKIIVN